MDVISLIPGFSLLVRRRLIIKKINILNYMLFSTLIIYISETLQTITICRHPQHPPYDDLYGTGFLYWRMVYTAPGQIHGLQNNTDDGCPAISCALAFASFLCHA
ncbi:hypothetical protein AAC723_28750 (plasmid) [Klebsiella pneumoniae]